MSDVLELTPAMAAAYRANIALEIHRQSNLARMGLAANLNRRAAGKLGWETRRKRMARDLEGA